MIDVVFLVCFPTETEWSTLDVSACLFVEDFHIVPIGCGFLFGISQSDFRDGLFIPFSKSTWFWCPSCGYLRLDNVSILYTIVLKPIILGKGIFVRSVSPCCCRLIPTRCCLLERYLRVWQYSRSVGFNLIVEICRMGLITTHVMSGKHASVFFVFWLRSWLGLAHLFLEIKLNWLNFKLLFWNYTNKICQYNIQIKGIIILIKCSLKVDKIHQW